MKKEGAAYPAVWPFSSVGKKKSGEKRYKRETGVQAHTDSERLAHGRYFEVPTFSRWSFSLYLLTLSTHPRSSVSSPRISLLPFAFNHARILSPCSIPPLPV